MPGDRDLLSLISSLLPLLDLGGPRLLDRLLLEYESYDMLLIDLVRLLLLGDLDLERGVRDLYRGDLERLMDLVLERLERTE